MSLEQTLSGWTGPSSATEQEKQDRTERMVKEAVNAHSGFNDCSLSVYPKGSYANNTNVRADSDVDIAVRCHNALYFDGPHTPTSEYVGPWTPQKLRSELEAALIAKFGSQVDTGGSVAIGVNSSTARVDADVVPCFDYRRYFGSGGHRDGARIFRKTGGRFENYPEQHLAQGKRKNERTNRRFKKAVRIMKRVANRMENQGVHPEVPSYFIECLVYNCSDHILTGTTWTGVVSGILGHVWEGLDGPEPEVESDRWREVNQVKFLFHPAQKWTRDDGRSFAYAAWNHLGLAK